jgi:hypothetical protein
MFQYANCLCVGVLQHQSGSINLSRLHSGGDGTRLMSNQNLFSVVENTFVRLISGLVPFIVDSFSSIEMGFDHTPFEFSPFGFGAVQGIIYTPGKAS